MSATWRRLCHTPLDIAEKPVAPVSRLGDDRDVAELATLTCGFAIIMEYADARGPGRIRYLADQIEHSCVPGAFGRSERASGNSEQVIGKLAGFGAFDRPMSRIMNAWRKLICQQPVVDDEQFERDYADVIQPLQQSPDIVARQRMEFRGGNGRGRKPQNAVTMLVSSQRINGNFPANPSYTDD